MRVGNWRLRTLAVLVAVLGLSFTPASAQSRLDRNADWLTTVNFYRAASKLPPVVEEPAWTAGIQAHLRYLNLTASPLRTGQYASMHTENPDSPYYSTAGAAEGSSNLVSGVASDREAVEFWMAAPFHAIGILRPNLQRVAFFRDPETGRAGLDVLRGLGPTVSRGGPVLFPGPDSSSDLTSFGGNESPDPLETCGYGSAGLPLVAMMPEPVSATPTAEVLDGNGAVLQAPGNDLCVVAATNYTSRDSVYGPTGKLILQNDRAVLVIPRNPLRPGRYEVRIHQPSRPDVSWAFYVSGYAGTRIAGGGVQRIHVSDTGGSTVMGNLTVVEAAGDGWTTAYPCADPRPNASNNNYVAGQTVPNFVVLHADAAGDVCVWTRAAAHVLWDQVGQTSAFSTSNARRLADTRGAGAKVAGGDVLRIHVSDGGGATVMGNLTVVDPEGDGWTTAYPCTEERPNASNNNYVTGQTVPNFAVLRADSAGDICVWTRAAAHLIWDQVGQTTAFSTANARRLVDTRAEVSKVAAGGVQRIHVSDIGGNTVMGNLTVVQPEADGWTTAYPCADDRPNASNNNYVAGQTVPNFAILRSDGAGDICVWTRASAHLIWDQVGQTSAFGTSNARRLVDTRVD